MKRLKTFGTPQYPYASQRARVQRLIQEGLCTICGAAPPREGRRYCAGCAERHKASNARCLALALERGICVQCRKRATRSGKRMCAICARRIEKSPATVKRLAAKRAASAAKPCRECGELRGLTGDSYGRCQRCYDKRPRTQAEYMNLVVSRGFCQSCRKPRGEDGTTRYCRRCARRHSLLEHARQLRSQGRYDEAEQKLALRRLV